VPQFPTDSPTELAHPEAHACQRRGRLAWLSMELSAALFLTDWPMDRKNQVAFLKFLVRISIYYRQNLMPPTTINVPSVIPSEKLVYKTPLPPFGLFFLLAPVSISSPLRLSLVFGRDFIVLVVVLNILKGM